MTIKTGHLEKYTHLLHMFEGPYQMSCILICVSQKQNENNSLYPNRIQDGRQAVKQLLPQ